MKVLFTSVNLLGDLVNITPALYAWKKENPQYKIELRIQDQQFCEILQGIPDIEVKRVPGDFEDIRKPPDRKDYDFFWYFDLPRASKEAWGKNLHISEGYGRMLNVKVENPWPIISPINPTHPSVDDPYSSYIIVAPFAGSAKIITEDNGGERSLPYSLWKQIINLVYQKTGMIVFILGYSKSPWDMWYKYTSNKEIPQVIYNICEESIVTSLSYIVDKRCKGVILPDSGVMHCVSGLCKQQYFIENKKSLPSLVFLTSVIPDKVSIPHGIPKNDIVVHREFCGEIKIRNIFDKINTFCDLVVANK